MHYIYTTSGTKNIMMGLHIHPCDMYMYVIYNDVYREINLHED